MWRHPTYLDCTHSTTPTRRHPMPTITPRAHKLTRLRATRPVVLVLTTIMTIAYATTLAIALTSSVAGSRQATSAAARRTTPNASRSLLPSHPRRCAKPHGLRERKLTQALLPTWVPGGTRSDPRRS